MGLQKINIKKELSLVPYPLILEKQDQKQDHKK